MSETTPTGEEGTGIVDDLTAMRQSPRASDEGINYQEQLIQDENGAGVGSELEFDEEVKVDAPSIEEL